MNGLKKHIEENPINKSTAVKRLDPKYNSPERIKRRQSCRISKQKTIKANNIENLKTKKKHP